MAAELSQLAEANFDPIAFVNNATQHRPPDEPVDRYWAELEMKLQLSAEDMEMVLQEHSLQALQRIPTAVHEVKRMQNDAATLRDNVSGIIKKLEANQSSALASVSILAQVDRVRSRMETAVTTLREATGLSDMLQRVEAVFNSGDLQQMSDMLAQMSKSLQLVGNVPGFEDSKAKLRALEDRLQGQVEGPLATAFAQQKGDKAQQLAGILTASNRGHVVQRLYLEARLAPLATAWEQCPPTAQGGFAGWLPGYYDEVVRSVEHQTWWCSDVLPQHHPQLVVALVEQLLQNTEREFVQRLDSALTDTLPVPMPTLFNVQAATERFALSVRQALHMTPSDELLLAVMMSIFAPLEAVLPRYKDLEKQQLQHEIDAMGLSVLSVEDADAVVSVVRSTVPKAFGVLEAAVERCMQLTGGSGLPELQVVVDTTASHYLDVLERLVLQLSRRLTDGPAGGALSATQETSGVADHVNSVLPLLGIARMVGMQLSLLDAMLRGRITDFGATLQSLPPAAEDPTNPLLLRLARPTTGQALCIALQQLAEQASAARFTALPNSLQACKALDGAVQQFLLRMLMAKVTRHLAGVPSMPEWTSGAAEGPGGVKLPAFSVYPSAYITAVGEYLMMLPQLLEALEDAEGREEGGEEGVSEADAANEGEWLDKVATGAAELYADKLEQLPGLSANGALQLNADLEYICNVLSALSVALPTRLASWQVLMGLPDEDLAMHVEATVADAGGSLSSRVMDRVLALRAP